MRFSSPSKAMAALSAEFWDTRVRRKPLLATLSGYPRHHDLLEDISPSGYAAAEATLRSLLHRLLRIDRASLPEQDRLSWDTLKYQIEIDIESFQYKFWMWDVDQVDGPQTLITTVVGIAQPMKTEGDAQALLRRIGRMPGFFRDLAGNLRSGMKAGKTAARTPTRKVIRQIEEALAIPPEKTGFAEAARRLPAPLRKVYEPRVLRATIDQAYSGYAAYKEFLKREYLPSTRPDQASGLCHLAGGKRAYEYRVRFRTTLDVSAREIHRIGLEEIASIHAEMREIARGLGHRGALFSFFRKTRSNPRLHFSTSAEIVREATRAVAELQSGLPAFFRTLPKTPVVVRRQEPHIEETSPGGQYFDPPDDLSRPGIFYVNALHPRERPRFTLRSLAAHEALPGHHLQLAIAVENRKLPTFRRHSPFTAFIEGWALYSERLADEMGAYPDTTSRFGMLTDQVFRAARLAVDTGIHALGWSRSRAIRFMLENTPMSRSEVEVEIDRYIVWPGQALAYMMGQRAIVALRRETAAALGEKFDVRVFHDAVLRNGALPLPILRKTVRADLGVGE